MRAAIKPNEIAVEYAVLNSFGNAWEFINSDSKQVPRPVGNVITRLHQTLTSLPASSMIGTHHKPVLHRLNTRSHFANPSG